MVNVRFYGEKYFCLQHCCGAQTHWWEAFSVTPPSSPPPFGRSSLKRSGGVQRVVQHSPRTVEISLFLFISDLVTAGNEKLLGWLDFQ